MAQAQASELNNTRPVQQNISGIMSADPAASSAGPLFKQKKPAELTQNLTFRRFRSTDKPKFLTQSQVYCHFESKKEP